MNEVEILWISRSERMITVRYMPQSERALIDALLKYWKEREMPWSITEVLRFDKPQRIFYSVLWTSGEKDEEVHH